MGLWKVVKGKELRKGSGKFNICVEDENGYKHLVTGQNQMSKAIYIVHCVNTYTELLETLKYVVNSGESYERVQEIAAQTLTKVEGFTNVQGSLRSGGK